MKKMINILILGTILGVASNIDSTNLNNCGVKISYCGGSCQLFGGRPGRCQSKSVAPDETGCYCVEVPIKY